MVIFAVKLTCEHSLSKEDKGSVPWEFCVMMDLVLGAAVLGTSDSHDFGAVDEDFGAGGGVRPFLLFR